MESIKHYLATVAEKGAGKGLFVALVKQLLSQRRVAAVRFSDPLREILAILNKEVSRENLWKLAGALRSGFSDEAVLNPAMRKRIEALDADVIILDGLRKPEEIALVRELGGSVVFISADQHVRFERRRKESENADEQDMSWEQFVAQDQTPAETSILSIGETQADARIENNGTVEEFTAQIKTFLANHGLDA